MLGSIIGRSVKHGNKEPVVVPVHVSIDALTLNEEEDPLHFSPTRKWVYTILVCFMTAIMAFSSSIHTAAISAIANDFHCPVTLATAGVSTFLLGFGTGPLIFAPLSEVYGRNPIFRSNLLLFVLCNVACALSPNIAALLVFRFLTGFCGSPSVTNSAGSITDIWPMSDRSVPLALFTAGSFLGPVIAPIIGGFVTQYAGWRWDYWLVVIIGGIIYLFMILVLPETYREKLLEEKAKRLGIPPSQQSLKQKLQTSLTRPTVMFFTEPILFLLSLYMAFVFGILYLDFTAYTYIFQKTRHWDSGIAGLSLLGMGVGMAFATAASPFVNRIYAHYVKKLGGPKPEARLPHLIFLSWLIPIGLLWFAWTADPKIHWASSILSGIPFGIGFVSLFLGITSYLIDCYGRYAASALAANAILRSTFGAVFPLFSREMYESLGSAWATSILGFVAVVMAPLPYIFYQFGPHIRAKSKFHQRMLQEEASVNLAPRETEATIA